MDDAPQRFPCFGHASIELGLGQRRDRKPSRTARYCAGIFPNLNAEPLEEADVSKILVRRFSSTNTLGGDTAIISLPKKCPKCSASVKQTKGFDASQRREVDSHLRCDNVRGQAGGEVERGGGIK